MVGRRRCRPPQAKLHAARGVFMRCRKEPQENLRLANPNPAMLLLATCIGCAPIAYTARATDCPHDSY